MLGQYFKQQPQTRGIVADAALGNQLPMVIDQASWWPSAQSIPQNIDNVRSRFLSITQVRTCAGDTRRTNGRTRRSDTRSAVHGPSSPQGPRSSPQRSSPRVSSKRWNPAAGSSRDHDPERRFHTGGTPTHRSVRRTHKSRAHLDITDAPPAASAHPARLTREVPLPFPRRH
jgi:hypothetical protein